ncbi:hypothetical protein [Candidatus Leptofilum sp.]|uniref:hypothetical protein n=1 Tax=Candidatus Leptofilum sp. TaxID=3241576 RepID=UPI003B5C2FEC
MQQRRFIVGSLILFFFILTGGLTSCALFENASGTDLTNAVGMSNENGSGPGSGQWVPPVPQNRNQCLQLHGVGVTLKENLDSNVVEMERIRNQCVDTTGAFLPGVDQEECIKRYDQFFAPAELILADLIVGGTRYEDSCISADEDNTLPPWPELAEKEGEEEAPKATAVPEATKAPETGTGSSGGSTCCWCLTCTHRIDTGYIMRPLIISPKG